MANKRAAIVIGIDAGGGLTPLDGAALSACRVAEWLRFSEPGYDIKLITDQGYAMDDAGRITQGSAGAVTFQMIEDAVHGFATSPPRYRMLVVYFCGHGIYENFSDSWLLSRAPQRTRELVSVNRSADNARYSGIPNVVIISDACRSRSTDVTAGRLEPGNVFPAYAEQTRATTKVDEFRATAFGTAAYMMEIDGLRQSLLTYALRRAYLEPWEDMVRTVRHRGRDLTVVPNRSLEDFLQEAIDLAGEDEGLTQNIEVSVPSKDDVFIAPVDPVEAPTGGGGTRGGPPRPEPPVEDDFPVGIDDAAGPGDGGADGGAADGSDGFPLDHAEEDWTDGAYEPAPPTAPPQPEPVDDEWADAVDEPGAVPARPRPMSVSRSAAGMVRAVLRGDGPDALANAGADLVDAVGARAPEGPSDHFESGCGFFVHGAQVAGFVTSAARTDIRTDLLYVGDAVDPAVLRVWTDEHRPASAAIVLEDGRSFLAPTLPGYIGHIRMDDQGIKDLSFVPVDTGDAWNFYVRRKQELDAMRAAVALAIAERRLHFDNNQEARAFARYIRYGKALDPSLGLYAAWAYYQGGFDRQIASVLDYMRRDLDADLFDVRMLAHRSPPDTPLPMVPACPILTQGWSLLDSRGITLPEPLRAAQGHLTGSMFTTFAPGFGPVLTKALHTGEFQ